MAATDKHGLTVSNGDSIEVQARGLAVRGTVASVDWYDPEGWYIEITGANVPGGYSYWKQREDGGRISVLNGVAL